MRTARLSHFIAVTPAMAARLRNDPSAVTALREGRRDEAGLGRYAHAVQYLLAGRARGVRGPHALLTGGGEKFGRTPGGPVRYLSPELVAQLSVALDEVAPDDLGDDSYDEAAMDAAGVEPGRWVRDGGDTDRLGTIRELYSYLRDFLRKQRKAKKGVVIVTTEEPVPDDAAEEDDGAGADLAAAVPPPPIAAAPAEGGTGVVLVGANGRRYDRAQGKPVKALDASLAGLAYRPLGDLAVLPVLADRVVRTYRSDDGTAVAAAVLSEAQDKAASLTFFSTLSGDALVLTSDAFVLEKVKKRLFATMMSSATPAELDAALRERRGGLLKKHGAPVPVPAELAAAARVWEAWWAKQDR